MAVREIELPYAPRKAFMPFHNRTHRWACLVAHRRAGKTVAAINDMIRAAFTSKDSMPLYGYVAPYRTQAKSVVWDYLKHYSLPICKDSNEAELTVTLVNDSKIRLFGADNADAMRGLGCRQRGLSGFVRSVLRVSVHPRQRRDPLLYWPRALFLICRLLAVGSISTPVVT